MTNDYHSDFPIDWLRHTSPYINTHRGSTIVIWFGGELLNSDGFLHLVHDLTLLSHLGLRLVLVHGMRPQIDSELEKAGIAPSFGPGDSDANGDQIRITSTNVIPALQSAMAKIRCQIESAFSTGLPNTPMSGAQVTVCSGNFVVAKPYGVRNGIDYCHTGEFRKFRSRTVGNLLDLGIITLLPPVGYSPTGELFNLQADELATRIGIELQADKLVFLHESAGTRDNGDIPLRELSATNINFSSPHLPEELAPLAGVIEKSLHACRNGVKRCHIVSSKQDGALLKELFTRDGSGLLIDSDSYETIRSAGTRDVAGIMELIRPLIDQGILIDRSEQGLEREIDKYYVAERDGSVIGCASLTRYEDDQAEVGCLAIHPDFRASGKAAELVQFLANTARRDRCRLLFALSTRSGDWFQGQGFVPAPLDTLPETRNNLRDKSSRGSKLYALNLI